MEEEKDYEYYEEKLKEFKDKKLGTFKTVEGIKKLYLQAVNFAEELYDEKTLLEDKLRDQKNATRHEYDDKKQYIERCIVAEKSLLSERENADALRKAVSAIESLTEFIDP